MKTLGQDILPVIVDFEGLDYSFKETNSTAFTAYLNNIEHISAKRYAFPSYGDKSAYLVEQYLSGKIPATKRVATSLFLADMMNIWNTKIQEDIKNGIEVIVFDRYWYSNIFYNSLSSNVIDAYEKIGKMAHEYTLPDADFIFCMAPYKCSFNEYYTNNNKREGKDIYEKNIDYLSIVFDKFIAFYNMMAHFGFNTKTYQINVAESNAAPRNKQDIFRDIIEYSLKDIKEGVKICQALSTQHRQ